MVRKVRVHGGGKRLISGGQDHHGLVQKEVILFKRLQVGRFWHRALARRSHTGHVAWERMHRLVEWWLRPARICHPYSLRRLGVVT
jgi:hypothetical protein